MSRRMTVVFHDEELYTQLKIEAARRHTAASEIVADAVREWLENREDAELLPVIEAARSEWKEKGGHLADDYCRDFKNTARQYCRQDETKRLLLNYGSIDEGEETAIKYPSREVCRPHQAMILDTTRG